jgi:hypothetical protein
MITEKNHKLLTSQLFVTDCTKKGLASMLFGNYDYSYDVNSKISRKVWTFINQTILGLSQKFFTCTSYFLPISVKILNVYY